MAGIMDNNQVTVVMRGSVITATSVQEAIYKLLSSSPAWQEFKQTTLLKLEKVWAEDAAREKAIEDRPWCTGCGKRQASYETPTNFYCTQCVEEMGLPSTDVIPLPPFD